MSLRDSWAALDYQFKQLPDDPVRVTLCVTNKWVGLRLVDLVMMSLLSTQEMGVILNTLHTLYICMPEEVLDDSDRPTTRVDRERTCLPGKFIGKTIVYSGAPENVPHPWYDLGSLACFGVSSVIIQRTLTPAELTHLAASAYVHASSAYALSLSVQGLNGNMDEEHWAAIPEPNSGLFCRIRKLDLGDIGREMFTLGHLLPRCMAAISKIELTLTRKEDGAVLSGIVGPGGLRKLRVEYKTSKPTDAFARECKFLGLDPEKKEKDHTVKFGAER
ncbi:hypothetical protein EV715DRAFT_293096 [Schizophyllum commune]